MTLNDETGDPRDEGYMDAVRELRDWVGAIAADNDSAAGSTDPSSADR